MNRREGLKPASASAGIPQQNHFGFPKTQTAHSKTSSSEIGGSFLLKIALVHVAASLFGFPVIFLSVLFLLGLLQVKGRILELIPAAASELIAAAAFGVLCDFTAMRSKLFQDVL
ncbi:hypothetical protein OPV22_024748 [Ensete ventricosum]|uniref:SLC26A/SulP transporter domain-containing protein n=1 Tax=Ensete ventricosum TaxID=4639 RepID=A0AAV8QFS3_ENSVE|nr:hypothetical protein OPV22_024748 [Ensete ventricosum]